MSISLQERIGLGTCNSHLKPKMLGYAKDALQETL
jgi:hypothetical protein